MTDKLIPFTFKDTGIDIALKPVPMSLILEINRMYPKPLPPLDRVQNGDGSWRDEPNYDAPSYADALSTWREDLEEATRRLCIKRGVVLRLNEEQQAAVDEIRTFMKSEYGRELDADDKYIYVTMVAAGSTQDYQDLVEAVMRRPTDPKSTSG